jgi:hypothetical protein
MNASEKRIIEYYREKVPLMLDEMWLKFGPHQDESGHYLLFRGEAVKPKKKPTKPKVVKKAAKKPKKPRKSMGY